MEEKEERVLIAERGAYWQALYDMAAQLDRWADESVRGGWSTHQVEPMRKKADELRRIILSAAHRITLT
jgi:hypothetical protein